MLFRVRDICSKIQTHALTGDDDTVDTVFTRAIGLEVINHEGGTDDVEIETQRDRWKQEVTYNMLFGIMYFHRLAVYVFAHEQVLFYLIDGDGCGRRLKSSQMMLFSVFTERIVRVVEKLLLLLLLGLL